MNFKCPKCFYSGTSRIIGCCVNENDELYRYKRCRSCGFEFCTVEFQVDMDDDMRKTIKTECSDNEVHEDKIIEKFDLGYNITDISIMLDVSSYMVKKVLKSAGRNTSNRREERNKKIVKAIDAGCSTREVAAKFGLTTVAVTYAYKTATGIGLSQRDGESIRERNGRIIALRDSGFTTSQLSKIFGLTSSHICTIYRNREQWED